MTHIEAKSKGRVRASKSRELYISHEHVIRGSYSRQRIDSFGALGCNFESCDFRDLRVRQAVLASGREQTKYTSCNFDGSRFGRIIAGQVRFEGCSFLDVEFNQLFGHAAEFINCQFSGVLKTSVFFGQVTGNYREDTKRRENEFRGNDFSKMRFEDVDFRGGIDLSLQKLPEGSDYLYLRNAAKTLSLLRSRYLQAPISPCREAVFSFVSTGTEQINNGQTQLFCCKSSEPFVKDLDLDAIWTELRDIDASVS